MREDKHRFAELDQTCTSRSQIKVCAAPLLTWNISRFVRKRFPIDLESIFRLFFANPCKAALSVSYRSFLSSLLP
jgi:hypothetical protein